MAGINDYSNTAGSNTTINGIDISEGCSPAGINNAIRQLMADIADMDDGVVPLQTPDINGGTIDGASLGASSPITSAVISGDLTVDTDTLFVDSSSDRVGVGQTSPTANLHIGNDSAGSENTVLRIEGGSTSGFSQVHFADSGDNNIGRIQYTHASDFMALYTNDSEALRIDSSGHVIIPNGVTLGTATGVYNAANTLDDYEEGTFTPSAGFSSAGPTAGETTGTGSYTKVGNMVTVWGTVTNINVTGASGDARIKDLPFTSTSDVTLVGYQGTAKLNRVDFEVGYINAEIPDGQTYVRFPENRDNTSTDFLNVNDCSDGLTDFYFTVTYKTDS